MSRITVLVGVATCAVAVASASAQPLTPSIPTGTATAEATVGYTGFGDDSLVHHTGMAGTVRVHLTPRISVGPEFSYHIGPSEDRDLLVQGVAYFDLRRPRLGHPGRIEPYVLVGAGLMSHDAGCCNSAGVTGMWGGGARIWVTPRSYVVADARLGWPANVRVATGMGLLLR